MKFGDDGKPRANPASIALAQDVRAASVLFQNVRMFDGKGSTLSAVTLEDSTICPNTKANTVGTAMTARQEKPLWRCPKCGHRFVTKNLWHSCGRYRLVDHFKDKPRGLRVIFDQFVKLARACGPVTVYAQKTRIVIQARVRFAGAIVHRDWLEATMWLKRPAKHPRLRRTESFGALGYGLHFCLREPADIDDTLAKLMREAYHIGEQRPGA